MVTSQKVLEDQITHKIGDTDKHSPIYEAPKCCPYFRNLYNIFVIVFPTKVTMIIKTFIYSVL